MLLVSNLLQVISFFSSTLHHFFYACTILITNFLHKKSVQRIGYRVSRTLLQKKLSLWAFLIKPSVQMSVKNTTSSVRIMYEIHYKKLERHRFGSAQANPSADNSVPDPDPHDDETKRPNSESHKYGSEKRTESRHNQRPEHCVPERANLP